MSKDFYLLLAPTTALLAYLGTGSFNSQNSEYEANIMWLFTLVIFLSLASGIYLSIFSRANSTLRTLVGSLCSVILIGVLGFLAAWSSGVIPD